MLKDFVSLSSASLLLIISPFAVSQVAPPTSTDGPVMVTRQALHHDLSPSLRDLAAHRAPAPQPVEEREVDDLKVIPLRPGFKPAAEPDTVLQRTIAKTSAEGPSILGPVAGLNFEGLGTGIPNFVIVGAPPDTEGAVGATQYVQWVNTSFAVFDKASGAMTLGPVLANTLWAGFGGGCETNNDGDPIVTYDKLADRWVFTQFVVRSQPFLQCVAVSTTSDATGTYNRYSFQYSDVDDYPKLGVWPDAYYITFNMFASLAGGFLGAEACAYDRNAMLQGLPAQQICFPQASTGSLLPADLDGHIMPPPGSPNYMLNFDVNSLNLYKFHVDFSNPANSTFIGPLNIPVAAFTPFCPSVRGCVPQPSGGDGTALDSLGDRLMYRLAYRNFGDHESLVVNHSVVADGTVGNSGVRWYEIQNPNDATPLVAQQSTFAPDAGSRWMGSVAMDASGNLAVGYSVIGNATTPPSFASIAFAARGAFDTPSTLGSETMIVTGKGAQTGGLTRWGDYSAMQVDPADDCTFWYTNEYLQNTGLFNWNTRIATFKFPGCGAQDLTIAKSHAGKFTQGQKGVTYTINVRNVGGKPTDGSVVTVTDTLPAGLAATAISSTDPTWVCTLATLSCTRSDVLAAGTSYPAITVTVNVAVDAPGLVTNSATVSGGGSKDSTGNTANDPTVIIVTGPDPTIVKSHAQSFPVGQSGAYTITVTNVGLTATDPAQPLTVTDTLPSGLTAVAASGTGWGTCVVGTTVTCTRSDSLTPGQSYPPITLVVNVASNAPSALANVASVAGGGDANLFNNSSSDLTSIVAQPPGMAITNPPPSAGLSGSNEFKPGTQIAVAGTATGPTFQDFRMQWAEGSNPTSGWSSAGITLANGGTTPVTNGPLGTWDTSGLTTPDYYTLRLLVDNAGYTNQVVTVVYLEPSLLSVNWPVALKVAPHLDSGFLPATDAAGKQRLALVTPVYLTSESIPPQYFSFVPDNSSQNVINIPQPSYLNPAVGNIDGSPGDQVVISEDGPAQVQIFRSDNTSFAFPLGPSFSLYNLVFNQPVLEDVGGKGELDVISLTNNFNAGFGVNPAALFAWHPDGSLLGPNFPIIIPDLNVNLALGFKPRVFVADLRGDGTKEFIVETGTSSSSFTVLLFAADGTPIPWAVPVFSGFPLDLALADLDHNGKLETISLMTDNSGSASLHVFQPDGSERPGFPVSVGLGTGGHLAVGDLNRDGTEEIVVLLRNQNLVVLEPDGTPFPGAWAQIAPGNFLAGPLALADIDGDGFPEILLTAYQLVSPPSSPALAASPDQVGRATIETTHSPEGLVSQTATTDVPSSQQTASQYWAVSLLAVRHDATVARSWNLPGANGNQPFSETKITVGDFNQDGSTDIAVTYFTIDGGGLGGFLTGGVASVFTTGTQFHAAANDWPMLHHDPHNTAVLRRAVTVVLTSPVGGTNVAANVPITAVTSGNVASVQFKIDGTNFGAPVTAAPFTRLWDTTQSALGAHQLLAVATDSNGQPVASAPLTVNVIRGSSSTVDLALTAGANPSTFGDSLTFTANVRPITATGTVTFFDGTTPISGAVPLSSGSASLTTSLLAAATHNITAQYSGDSAVGSSISAPLPQTVQPALLTITADNSTTVYGVAPPPFSGSISGAKNGDVFTLHFSTTATQASPAGNYPVTPSVTGPDLQNYTVHAVNGTLTITQAGTSAAVATSNASVNFGTPVTFTATIASATIGTPTGPVQFLDGSTVLGTVTLNAQGVAALTTSSLPVGSHSITAQYGGDANFTASISPAVSQQVIPADFSIGASPSSATIRAGGSASFTFTVTPVGVFNQTVNFSCVGLPAESQCTFVPPSVTPNGGPVTSTLTITTTAPSAVLGTPPLPKNNLPLYASLSGAMLGMLWIACSVRTRGRVRSRLLLLAGSLCLLVSLTSCGGGGGGGGGHHDPGTPPGTSSVTVTATSGSNSHPATVTLNVTN